MGTSVRELNIKCTLAELFACFKDEKVVFLDSSKKNHLGQYSIIGRCPYLRLEESGRDFFVNGKQEDGDLLTYMKKYLEENKEENPTDLPMINGALGYLNYDFGRKFERIRSRHEKVLDMPDALFQFFDCYLIEDLNKGRIYLSSPEKIHTIDWYEKEISKFAEKLAPAADTGITRIPVRIKSDFEKEEYLQAIEQMIDYIIAGDIYIANMTRQIVVDGDRDPYDMFRYMREHNAAPFGSYINDGSYQIVSASPERFMEVRKSVVNTRPIKGTRKRGSTPEEDLRMKKELEDSEKDHSELLMIVDLERNDLNRICKAGSVKVTELFNVEAYATVFHLVSTIQGELEEDKTAVDLIQAAFPGGSITGAPKIRAMEIIDELEHSARGLYTGSIGYFSMDGDCDLNIVIRTAVHQDGRFHIGAGGGITAESEPEFEFEETWQKAAAVVEAIAGEKVEEYE